MILTPEETSRRNIEAGVWSRLTVDQVFRRQLAATPDAVAFRDAGVGGVPGLSAIISFREAERRIEGLAAFFGSLGLKPDTVLGIHLPACADAAIVMLAAFRAGLVVCPLPVYWAGREIQAAIDAASIRGIVTASSIEGEPSGERIRDVAADTFSIRFVFSLGTGSPDGLIALEDIFADLDALGAAPEIARRGNAADHVALLSLASAPDERLVVVPHSHNQLVASALAHLLEGRIDGPERILTTMHPASVATVSGALLTAFLAGGSVAFHHGMTLEGLVDAALVSGASRLLLPAAFGQAVDAVADDHLRFSLVSSGLDARSATRLGPGRTAVDLLTLGGTCLLPVARRPDGLPGRLPLGATRLPMSSEAGPVFFETRLRPKIKAGERKAARDRGELLISGAIVPDAPWPEPASGGSGAFLAFTGDGFLRTTLNAEPDEDRVGLRISGTATETVVVAGRALSAARLDGLFRNHPDIADAAVFGLEAVGYGTRLGLAVVPRRGAGPSLSDIVRWLDGQGAGALDRPVTLMAVQEIPRNADGSVLREALLWKAVA